MDKRTLGFAVVAIIVGGAVLFSQAMLIGILAGMTGPTTSHGITEAGLEWRALWRSVLFTWALPSALGAMLLASFKPQSWALYSACAVAPGVFSTIFAIYVAGQTGVPLDYLLLNGVMNLALIPLFLALYYALIRRHTAA